MGAVISRTFPLRAALLLAAVSFALAAQTPVLSAQTKATAAATTTQHEWWQNAVIYEVYPRSFQDSNGDGIGDLNGITSRLDYLQSLGIDAIWIAPMFPSPNADFGYDISDYRGIDPQYGTMADFDRLMTECKKRNIRVLLDGVFNHSSQEHPWFLESKTSRTNPKADWYVWRDGKAPGVPPNNWTSGFSHGTAWNYVAERDQWYYHNFRPQQPDLNWRNPEVRKAIYDVMRFWYAKGVSGFRLDAMLIYLEDKDFRDNPARTGPAMTGDGGGKNPMTNNLAEDNDIFREMRAVSDEYPGRVLIGENYLYNIQSLATLYGAKHNETQLPMDMMVGFINKFDVTAFRNSINDAETKLDGNTPFITFDNHDKPRSWDRYGDGVHNDAIARIIATMLLTTRDAAQMYYGQEIGMVTTPPKSPEESVDPMGKLGWPLNKGRDGGRTPMQWNASKDAGFSTADRTWLPVPPIYSTLNVAAEDKQPGSLLNWYRKLIALRKSNAALRDGDFTMLLQNDAHVLAYVRQSGAARTVIACNFSAELQTIDLGIDGHVIKTLAANAPGMTAPTSAHAVTLPPFAAWIAEVN